ncbi:MAG: SHOCT domain-containing protein [Desulfuromusa sp.]|nr:SHOCT domain-containing protein [Desulfuromusa sp.]
MDKFKLFSITLVFILSTLISGCGGGGAEVIATNTTIGQELSDLQQAKDQGVITDKEYEEAKKKILER